MLGREIEITLSRFKRSSLDLEGTNLSPLFSEATSEKSEAQETRVHSLFFFFYTRAPFLHFYRTISRHLCWGIPCRL